MRFPRPRSSFALLATAPVLLSLSACDMFSGKGKYDNGEIDTPFEGTFRVGAPMDHGTFYKIAVADGNGSLTVEANGKEMRSLEFKVAGDDSLEFNNVTRDPYEIEMPLKLDEFKTILLLERPPTKLTFTERGARKEATPQEGQAFYVEGLFAELPLPIAMERVTEDMRIDLPFQSVEWDADLRASGGLIKPSRDGARVGGPGDSTWVKKPVLLGEVSSLKINGREIPLKSSNLNDGLLATMDFGDIKVELAGPTPDKLNFLVTLDQVRTIRKWLDGQ